jgi:hypothetical protein
MIASFFGSKEKGLGLEAGASLGASMSGDEGSLGLPNQRRKNAAANVIGRS